MKNIFKVKDYSHREMQGRDMMTLGGEWVETVAINMTIVKKFSCGEVTLEITELESCSDFDTEFLAKDSFVQMDLTSKTREQLEEELKKLKPMFKVVVGELPTKVEDDEIKELKETIEKLEAEVSHRDDLLFELEQNLL